MRFIEVYAKPAEDDDTRFCVTIIDLEKVDFVTVAENYRSARVYWTSRNSPLLVAVPQETLVSSGVKTPLQLRGAFKDYAESI